MSIRSGPWAVATVLALLLAGACKHNSDTVRPEVPRHPGEAGAVPPPPRLIVLFTPDLDSVRVERGMREGWLPHLRRLRTMGTLVVLAQSGSSLREDTISFLAGSATSVGPPKLVFKNPREMLDKADYLEMPPAVPLLEWNRDFRPITDELAQAGIDSLLLRCPGIPPVFGGDKVSVLAGGGHPDLSFTCGGEGRYTFVKESAEPTRIVEEKAGRHVSLARSTGDDRFDLFHFSIQGPPLPDGKRIESKIELRLVKDRSRGSATSGDDEVEIAAGRFTRPLRVRFPLSLDLAIFGRVRLYLRPTGLPSFECYVDPPDFDPIQPPEWMALAQPKQLAYELERSHGTLPRFSNGFPRAALDAGVLDDRDAAAALDQWLFDQRNLLESALLHGSHGLLVTWVDVMEEAAWFEREGAPDPEKKIEFRGVRVARARMADAAAGALDAMIGDLMARVDNRARDEQIALMLLAPCRAKKGLFGLTRLVAGEERSPTLENACATVFPLLGQPQPPRITATPYPIGLPMEPLAEERQTHIEFIEKD